MGDLVSAGLVFVGSLLHLGTRAFAGVNFAFALVWLRIVFRIAREHRKIEAGATPSGA
jgi:hypothetical protein